MSDETNIENEIEVEVEVSEEVLEENIEVKEVKLDNGELFHLLYLDAYIKNLELSTRIEEVNIVDQVEELQNKILELQNKLTASINYNKFEKEQKKAELFRLKQEIERKYCIDFSKCTFNEFSGVVTKIDE